MGFFCVLIFAQYSIPGGEGGAGFSHPRHLKSWVPPPPPQLGFWPTCSIILCSTACLIIGFSKNFFDLIYYYTRFFHYTLLQLYLGRHPTLSRALKKFYTNFTIALTNYLKQNLTCISVDCILSSPIVRNKKQFEGLNQLGLVVFSLICS